VRICVETHRKFRPAGPRAGKLKRRDQILLLHLSGKLIGVERSQRKRSYLTVRSLAELHHELLNCGKHLPGRCARARLDSNLVPRGSAPREIRLLSTVWRRFCPDALSTIGRGPPMHSTSVHCGLNPGLPCVGISTCGPPAFHGQQSLRSKRTCSSHFPVLISGEGPGGGLSVRPEEPNAVEANATVKSS
jgi:hypothetical protein